MKLLNYWKPVPEFECHYEVSFDGRIRRTAPEQGAVPMREFRSQKTSVDGYRIVRLSTNNKRTYVFLHRIVAEVFVLKTNSNLVINHIDGNKLNNCACNLEWITQAENNRHAFRIGLAKPITGPKNKNAKLSLDEAQKIRALYGTISKRSLAKRFNVHPFTIWRIAKNLMYKQQQTVLGF